MLSHPYGKFTGIIFWKRRETYFLIEEGDKSLLWDEANI
jgi:hypothetical protein